MARLIKGNFLEDLAVSTGKLAQSAITTEKLGDTSVTSGKLAVSSVITSRIADDAVTQDKIADNSIVKAHLTDSCVDSSEIASDAVTASKIKIAYGDSLRFVNNGGSVVGLSVDSDGDLVGPDTNKVASQSYVSTAIANLIDSAPGTLDTLNEIAASINDDANFATTVTNLINTVEASSGLGADGSYSSPGGTYLGSETTLKGGLSTLDSSLSSAVTSLTSSISSNVSSLEGKINTVEASVGLAADGSYTAFSGSNYMDSATSVTGALEDLDAQAKANYDAIVSNDSDISTNAGGISGLQTLADGHESAIGLNSNGTYSSASGTYLGSEASIKAGLVVLDTAIAAVASSASQALNVSKEQELVVISSSMISNNTISFELDELARWHESVCVQYGNLVLVPGASYDFTVASDASTQKTTVTLNAAYNQSGSKSLIENDVLVFRYEHDSSYTYSE
tara:strand:+ start:269 stop:1627 length:1359 start_codon:yes stop_codon:yes gene_type:complete